MAEGVKASFYLRFCDVLGEDPSTAMRKIVDEGIKIDSEFVETLQKQQKDAEEALKAAKLLAAVSGNTFTDPGLDISMKDEYEKASKLLESTEQLWDTLQTEDFEALPTTDTVSSQTSSTQASSLEEQIMRDMLGDAGGGGAAAGSPSTSMRSDASMSLYDQMDAMLGSISAGSFSSPNTEAAQPPSSPSQAAPLPPLRAPSRPQASPAQPQQRQQAQPAAKQPAAAQPPPPLASRPALSAASARADTDDGELSAADLERRAVELEEELFPGLAGQDALLEADAVTVARERLQAVKSGQADIGGTFDSAALEEDRFPDLEVEGVSMDSLLAAQAQPRAEKVKAPPPPQPAQPPPQLASRPQAPPPPPPTKADEPAPTPEAAALEPPAPKAAAKTKSKKKRSARKPVTEAAAAPATPPSTAPTGSGAAPPQPIKPPPRAPEKPKKPEKVEQTTPPPKPTPRAAAAPESAPKAPEAAKKPNNEASGSTAAARAVSAAAPPTVARPRPPSEPAAAPDRIPEPAAELAAEVGGDESAGESGPLSPAEAAALWAERSAEAELAQPLSRPELRPAARSPRMLDEAIQQTLVEAGKMPRPKAGKAALPRKRRKAQRGAAMKALDPEAMSKLLTPSPVAAQQAQKAGFVMRRPAAAPLTSARMGDVVGEFVGPPEEVGEAAKPVEPAPSLSARPVPPEATPDSAEAEAAGTAEAAVEAPAAPAAPGEPFYAMIAYTSAEGAHVTFGDRQSGVLPPALMSRHTAALLEDSLQPQAGGAEAFQPRLIRAVLADPRPDGTAVVSERGAYTFADVSTDAVSATLDPVIAEALLAAEARVEAYVWGPPDDSGGCLALFRPPAADLGIAQALLDTSGLPQMEAYLVDERPERPDSALPNLTRVEARVCGDGLANGVLKLTVLSTEHDTLLRKLTFEDAAMNARELPPEMLRCLSSLARFGEVPAVRVQQLLGSPTPAEQPQLYIGKEEKDVDKGGGLVERCMALHCKHLIVSCAVQSTLSRDQFMLALQTIVAETSSEPAASPR